MKKLLALALGLIALVAFAGVAHADLESMATSQVYVNVDPNVGVAALSAAIDAGTVQTGDFMATASFGIDSNCEWLQFYAAASDLYKGGITEGELEVTPIPLNMSEGVVIEAASASPVNGGSNMVAYINGETESIGEFPCVQTETIVFESSQDCVFQQEVTAKFTWTQDDPLKPKGQYMGKVKLAAMIVAQP
jgi:hypothetical protein